MTWRKILCAVDFSVTAHAALDEAVEIARQLGSELTMIHVDETLPTSEAALLACPPDVCKAAAFDLGRAVERWRLDAEHVLGRNVNVALASGSPAREIVRAAEEGAYDLVVIGTRGRSGVERALLGSVAEGVARRCRCPVLIARSPQASPTVAIASEARREPAPPRRSGVT
jgi:nucleotide-binding universal stress UspA family protein